MRNRIGSQWRDLRTSGMWSNFLCPFTMRAACCIDCNRFESLCGSLKRMEFTLSSSERTNADIRRVVDSWSRYLRIRLILWIWKCARLQMIFIWFSRVRFESRVNPRLRMDDDGLMLSSPTSMRMFFGWILVDPEYTRIVSVFPTLNLILFRYQSTASSCLPCYSEKYLVYR